MTLGWRKQLTNNSLQTLVKNAWREVTPERSTFQANDEIVFVKCNSFLIATDRYWAVYAGKVDDTGKGMLMSKTLTIVKSFTRAKQIAEEYAREYGYKYFVSADEQFLWQHVLKNKKVNVNQQKRLAWANVLPTKTEFELKNGDNIVYLEDTSFNLYGRFVRAKWCVVAAVVECSEEAIIDWVATHRERLQTFKSYAHAKEYAEKCVKEHPDNCFYFESNQERRYLEERSQAPNQTASLSSTQKLSWKLQELEISNFNSGDHIVYIVPWYNPEVLNTRRWSAYSATVVEESNHRGGEVQNIKQLGVFEDREKAREFAEEYAKENGYKYFESTSEKRDKIILGGKMSNMVTASNTIPLSPQMIQEGKLEIGDNISTNITLKTLYNGVNQDVFVAGKLYEVQSINNSDPSNPVVFVESELGKWGIHFDKKKDGGAYYFYKEELSPEEKELNLLDEQTIMLDDKPQYLIDGILKYFSTHKDKVTEGIPRTVLIRSVLSFMPYIPPDRKKEVNNAVANAVEVLRGHGYLEVTGDNLDQLKLTEKGFALLKAREPGVFKDLENE